MQAFIKIYQKVQEIGPGTLFSELEPRPIPNDICQSLVLHLVNINVYANFHHNIPLSSKGRAIFTISEFGARQNLDR